MLCHIGQVHLDHVFILKNIIYVLINIRIFCYSIYMRESSEKFILIINGSICGGKSTTAKEIKKIIKRTAVFDMDDIKYQISDFEKNNHDNNIIRNGVFSLAENYVNFGLNIIISHLMEIKEVEKYRVMAQNFGYVFKEIHLFADDECILSRYYSRGKKNPSLKDRVLRNINFYKNINISKDALCLETTNIPIEESVNFVLNQLKLK